MNEALRWTLILGCLSLAILEAPRSLPVLVQDLRGPWRASNDVPLNPTRALKPDGAFASVAPEHVLAPDRSDSDRLVRELASGRFAFLLAR